VYAIEFMAGHFHIAFFALAAVVLAVTGAEALYADMGHFGRPPITVAWLALVLPALVLNYFGQGALLLGDESLVNAPFFMLVPNWAQIPMILLATAATIIASQAVITGAYSVATQAARLGYLPRLRVSHTSESSIGQVYVPWINGVLLVGVLILVLAFRSSAALAYAYGMAVTGTIAISTLLFLYVAHIRWRVPVWALVVGGGSLLVVDLMFVAANESPEVTDKLVRITSEVGSVAVTGDGTIPAGGALVVGSSDGQDAVMPMGDAKLTTAEVTLTKPITNGLTYNFTFEFEKAGSTTVAVPLSAGESPARA
jgi:KUP system potassium uptake protein